MVAAVELAPGRVNYDRLRLSFKKVFLRDPVPAQGEEDFFLQEPELEVFADYVWN